MRDENDEGGGGEFSRREGGEVRDKMGGSRRTMGVDLGGG